MKRRGSSIDEAALRRDAAILLAASEIIRSSGPTRRYGRMTERELLRAEDSGFALEEMVPDLLASYNKILDSTADVTKREAILDGFGLFADRNGDVRTAIVTYQFETNGRFVSPNEISAVRDLLLHAPLPLETHPALIGLPPPLPQAGCGVPLTGRGSGSVGPAVVARHDGGHGVLTAGHVAGAVGTHVGVAGRPWGTVAKSTHGSSDPADVALALPTDGIVAFTSLPRSSRTHRPELGEVVAGYGAVTCKRANVMGIMPFQWFPALGRNLAEVVLTAEPISAPGDSGAPATALDDSALVGLVVGGDREQRTYTSVQLASYVMETVECDLVA